MFPFMTPIEKRNSGKMGNRRSGKKKRQHKTRHCSTHRSVNSVVQVPPPPVFVSQIETSEETESASVCKNKSSVIFKEKIGDCSENCGDSPVTRQDVSIGLIERDDIDIGVAASSTPIRDIIYEIQETSISDPNDMEISHVEQISTEETPLLRGTDLEHWDGVGFGVCERRRRFQSRVFRFLRSRSLWCGVIFVLMTILLALVLGFSIDFQELSNEAFTSEIKKFSVLGINENGVSFKVAGMVETNYDNVSNYLLRRLAKYTALLVGGIYISPKNECSIYITTEKVFGIRLLDMYPPGLAINLINHRVSEFEFTSDANFAAEGAARLFETIMSHGFGSSQTLEIEIRLSPKITGKWFGFQLNAASVFQTIQFPPKNFKFPFGIKDLNVIEKGNMTEVGFSLHVPPLPATFSFNEIQWNIAIPDCGSQPVNFGDWRTSGFNIDPDRINQIGFFGFFETCPVGLVNVCSDGITPINHSIRSAVNDKTLHVIVSAKRSEANSKGLPKWMYHILTSAIVNITLPIPHFQGDIGRITPTDVVIESSSFTVKTDTKGVFYMVVDTKSKCGVKLPAILSIFEILASNFTTQFLLKEENKIFIEARVVRNGEFSLKASCNNSSTLSLNCENVLVNVVEPQLAGQYMNALLAGHIIGAPQWTLYLEEATIKSHLISTHLKDLRFGNKASSSPDITESNPQSALLINWLLEKAQVSVDKIYLTYSDHNRVEFLVDFQVTNPLNVSFEIANEDISFDIKYNQTNVGILSFSNLKVPETEDRVLLTVAFTLFYDRSAQRIVSEDFLSHVISGAANILFSVSGSRAKSHKPETAVSRFLQEIQIDHLKLPEVNYTRKDALRELSNFPIFQKAPILDLAKRSDEQSRKQNPFFISATFHLLSSKIELTVFNPIANVELKLRIIKCLASHAGKGLAHVEWSEVLMIPPGLYTTPRLPIKIAKEIGADILRKYINGELVVNVLADLNVHVDQFPAEIMYRGENLTALVKL